MQGGTPKASSESLAIQTVCNIKSIRIHLDNGSIYREIRNASSLCKMIYGKPTSKAD